MRRGARCVFWGHDSAMEVASFITEDALKRVEPHMRGVSGHIEPAMRVGVEGTEARVCKTRKKARHER